MSESTTTTQRESSGRFAPGNQGGPGNPYNRQLAHARHVIQSALTDDVLRAITQVFIKMAMAGNLAAGKLLYQYAAGKPAQGIDPDRLNHHELQLAAETPPLVAAAGAALEALPAGTMCQVVQAVWPPIGEALADGVQKALETGVNPFVPEKEETEDEILDRGPDDPEEELEEGQEPSVGGEHEDVARLRQKLEADRQQTAQTAARDRHSTGKTGRRPSALDLLRPSENGGEERPRPSCR